MTAIALPGGALAAEAAARPSDLDEVVVTARRFEENVQKVPVTITVVTEEAVKRQDLRTFDEVAKITPALQICCNRGQFGSLFIRGVPGVATYFAGAPVDINGSGMLFDIRNVQVLKGPQGTLFGIATNGGAIVTEPRKPSNAWEGYAEGRVGDNGRVAVEGAVNLPLIQDKVLARLSLVRSKENGIVKVLATGRDIGDEDYFAVRGSLVVRPVTGVENYTVVNYQKDDVQNLYGVLSAVRPGSLATTVFGAATLNALLAQQQQLGRYVIAGTTLPGTPDRTSKLNVINTTEWVVNDNLSIKNIASYQWFKFFRLQDLDGTPLPIVGQSPLNVLAQPATRSWTEELQAHGKAFGGKLDFQLGTFHAGNVTPGPFPTYTTTLGGTSAALNKTHGNTHAVYGQATYDLSDLVSGLSVTGGYRYTWDERFQLNQTLNPANLALLRQLSARAHFKSPSYTLSLQYQVTPDTMIYVSDTRGYSAGGLQLAAPPGFQSFDPEKLTNYEFGIKTEFDMGGVKGRLNASVFDGEYDDVQITQTTAVQQNPLPAPPTFVILKTNAGKGRIQGFDAAGSLIPNDLVQLDAGVAYIDAKYTRYTTLTTTGQVVDLSSSPFALIPKWKYTLHGALYLPVDPAWGRIALHATYSYQTKVFADSTAQVNPPPVTFVPGFENLDLSLEWRGIANHAGLDGQLYWNNVTKNTVNPFGLTTYTSVGVLSLAPAHPRSYGARLRYSF